VALAESRRFPDLAATVGRMAREQSNETVAKLLGELTKSDEMAAPPAFAPERLAATAPMTGGRPYPRPRRPYMCAGPPEPGPRP
jgi:hypothetical protein